MLMIFFDPMKRAIKLIKCHSVAGMLDEMAILSASSWETILHGSLAFLAICEAEVLMALFWSSFSRIFVQQTTLEVIVSSSGSAGSFVHC